MYDELYAAWRFELENTELGALPSDFYGQAAAFLKAIGEEIRMLDKKTVKSTLLERELERAECMLQELIWTRYKKIVSFVSENQNLPSSLLADEEESLGERFVSFAESYQKFTGKLLKGHILPQISKKSAVRVRKRTVLRFIKAVPAVIGVDMKTYGPFMAEDVASLPMKNAKILVKQGLAERVEL